MGEEQKDKGSEEELKKEEPKIIIPDKKADVEEQKPDEDKIVVMVQFDTKTGSVGVKGPGNGQMYDEPMCFWLLDKAKDFIKGHNMMKARPKIVQPGARFGFPGGLKMKPRPG